MRDFLLVLSVLSMAGCTSHTDTRLNLVDWTAPIPDQSMTALVNDNTDTYAVIARSKHRSEQSDALSLRYVVRE